MNRLLKTILSASLMLLAGLPVLYSLYFITNKACIRYEMEQELNSAELTTLILDKNDLHWIEEGRELIINHRMFDVVKMTAINDDKVELTGLFDDAETELHAGLNRSLEKREADSNHIFPFIYYQLTFDKGGNTSYQLNAASIPRVSHTNFYAEFFPPVFLSRHFPPPRA